MKLKSCVHSMGLITCLMLSTASSCLNLINQTGEPIRLRIDGRERESLMDLMVRQSYFFADEPRHITVYMRNGYASTFYNVSMNPIFDTLILRKSGPCAVIGYTGKTRTLPAHTIPIIGFAANDCKSRGWNPATGALFSDLHTTTSASAPINFQPIR